MANISLTLYTNGFFGSVLKSPIQMGPLSVNNSVTNISRLGTFKGRLAPLLWVGGWDKWWRKHKEECCIAVEGGKARYERIPRNRTTSQLGESKDDRGYGGVILRLLTLQYKFTEVAFWENCDSTKFRNVLKVREKKTFSCWDQPKKSCS